MSTELRPGDWVTVLGQVVDAPTHPDDLVIEFFSHNEQWSGHVERERVEAAEVPEFAQPCTSLWRDSEADVLHRCESHYDHAERHHHGAQHWSDLDQYGNVEDAS